MALGRYIGMGLGGLAGGIGGFFAGGPAGAIGGASLGASIGGGIGGEFDPAQSWQQIGGLTDEQIQALAEVMRSRGSAAIEAQTRRAMQRMAGMAAGAGSAGLHGSGLEARSGSEVARAGAEATGELEGRIAQTMAQMYASRQYAPPPPSFMEQVGPQLAQIGAPLLMQSLAPSPAVGAGMGGEGGFWDNSLAARYALMRSGHYTPHTGAFWESGRMGAGLSPARWSNPGGMPGLY